MESYTWQRSINHTFPWDGLNRRWNSTQENWINIGDEDAEDQIGSVFAVQGIDLNKVGVMIGPDIRVNEDGVLTGHITDGTGYMMSLKDNGVDVIGKKMTIVGAGGAATAIEIQAALDGVAEISIFNRKDEFWANAEETVRKINEKTNCKAQLFDLADLDKLKEEIASSYLFTNATGMGMKPLEGQTYIPDKSFLRPDLIVSDVVYYPRETELLRMAKEVGCKTMNGLGMMLFQGAAAFKMWTGEDMPIEYMKEKLDIK